MSHRDILTFLVLLGASVAAPTLAARVRMPTAVVLILLGMGLGPLGISAVREGPMVSFVSELGFLLLMFMAGMEIDFEAIRKAGRSALLVPSLVVAGIFGVAVLLGGLFGLGGIEILVISAMSVGMPLAVLKETGQDSKDLGRHVMLTASIGEIVCILAITAVEMAESQGAPWDVALKVVRVALLLIVSVVLVRFSRAVVFWYPKPFRRLIEHHDVAELGVRVGLVVMLGFVALSALAGVEEILGAFIGGSLVGFVLRQKHALEAKIAALGNGFFIPVFFILVGVRFEARALDRDAVLGALALALLAGASKVTPGLVFARRSTGFRERLAAGFLLSAPLTLVVAIGSIGRKLGFIDAPKQASIVLVAMIVSIAFPVLFRVLVGKSAKEKPTTDRPSLVL